MKAKELRIGNFVNDYQFNRLVTVSTGVLEELDGGIGGFEPIPLTEEWLIRFGFKYQERDINRKDKKLKKFWISPYFGKHKCFWFEINIPDDESNDFRCAWLNWDIGGGRKFIHLPFPDSIKHVHQLQNLYFELTGEELKLTDQ